MEDVHQINQSEAEFVLGFYGAKDARGLKANPHSPDVLFWTNLSVVKPLEAARALCGQEYWHAEGKGYEDDTRVLYMANWFETFQEQTGCRFQLIDCALFALAYKFDHCDEISRTVIYMCTGGNPMSTKWAQRPWDELKIQRAKLLRHLFGAANAAQYMDISKTTIYRRTAGTGYPLPPA